MGTELKGELRIDSIKPSLVSQKTKIQIHNWIFQKFGKSNQHLEFAYQILNSLGWENDPDLYENEANYVFNYPQMDQNPNNVVSIHDPFPVSLWACWDELILAEPDMKNNNFYNEELKSFTVRLLFIEAGIIYRKCHHSFTEKEKGSFHKNSNNFMLLINSLGRVKYYGLYRDSINSFYAPRWKIYFEYLQSCLDNRKKIDKAFIEKQLSVFLPNREKNQKLLYLKSSLIELLVAIYQKYNTPQFPFE